MPRPIDPTRILALDPSLTKTGYALGPSIDGLIEAGFVTPKGRSAPAVLRAMSQAGQVRALIGRLRPTLVIAETPAPQAPRRTNRGQANYGLCVGAILAEIRGGARGVPVYCVRSDQWKRGKPKARLKAELTQRVPSYAAVADEDGGGDIADALGLLEWAATVFGHWSSSPLDQLPVVL